MQVTADLRSHQTQIQYKYSLHRTTRNSQQKAKLLDTNFPGVSIDPILLRLNNPTTEPGYVEIQIGESRVWVHGTVQAPALRAVFAALGA